MEEKGLLSVIVPVYNAGKHIKRCIESILNQDYKNLELLLVNDGSKDESLSICREYEKLDSRVRVFDKPNGGAASARNLGIREAKGEYIGFCDADDFFDHDAYSTLIEVMERNNLPTVECVSKLYNSEGKFIKKDSENREIHFFTTEEAIRQIFIFRGNVHLATRLTRAGFIKNLSIPEGKRVEDFFFTILLLLKTGGTAIYNYPFYNYVASEGSVTRSPGGSIYFDALYFFNKVCEELGKTDISLGEEKNYFLLKNYYLLSISLTKAERKRFKIQIKEIKGYLRKYKNQVKFNSFLTNKEKRVLKIARFSFRLTRLLFLIKNLGGKNDK